MLSLLITSGHVCCNPLCMISIFFRFPASSVLRICSTKLSVTMKKCLAQVSVTNMAHHTSLLEKHNAYSYFKSSEVPCCKSMIKRNVECFCDNPHYYPVEETLECPPVGCLSFGELPNSFAIWRIPYLILVLEYEHS